MTLNFTRLRALLIYRRCTRLVDDAHHKPHTRDAAHAYVLRSIKWALAHNQKTLAEKLSGYSLRIAEMS